LGTGTAIGDSKAFASQILRRLFGFLITLLVLFFCLSIRRREGRKVLKTSRNLFGEVGIHYVLQAIAAIRAIVNGRVLVGPGKGLIEKTYRKPVRSEFVKIL
jgi:hypothetical protein